MMDDVCFPNGLIVSRGTSGISHISGKISVAGAPDLLPWFIRKVSADAHPSSGAGLNFCS